MEIKVKSLNDNWIKFFGRLENIDSTRLTTFLIKFLSKFTDVNELVKKIKENRIILQTTSIYFEMDGNLYLPFNVPTFNFFKKIYNIESVNIKKVKRMKFLPIFSENFKEILKNLNISVDFEKIDFIEKNILDRLTMSSTVYTIEYSIIRPFRFSIVASDEIKNILYESINKTKIFSIGKKKSIGFGLCKFEVGDDILFNTIGDKIIYDRIEEEGYYYLLNRVLVDSDLLKITDLNKSYYELVKIVGYLEGSMKKLYSRKIWLFKEGSILYFKKSELKTYYLEKFEDELKYILPTRPILVKLNI